MSSLARYVKTGDFVKLIKILVCLGYSNESFKNNFATVIFPRFENCVLLSKLLVGVSYVVEEQEFYSKDSYLAM